MQEKIFQKIEEIRQKPEHVRVWYVWGAVGAVMVFVVFIWIFSLHESFRRSSPVEDVKKIEQKLPIGTGETPKQSIENLNGGVSSSENNLIFQ